MDVDAGDTDAPTTTATPIAGVYRAAPMVTLTADEPATIYYTTDGSTPTTSSTSHASPATFVGGAQVRFFAVDAAGNEESPQSIAYTIDRLGPAAVSGFTATVDGADIDLAWTNPTDASFDEVVIARVADVSNADPADDVIYTGSAEAFTDTAPGAGHHTYVAWARHDTGEVGEARTADTRIAEGAQPFTITINVTAGTATVSAQPTRWTLAIASYDDTAGDLTFDLTATSGLAGVTFAAKAVVDSIVGTGGVSTFDSEDGSADFGAGSKEYQRLGAEGLLSGGSHTIPVAITANGATSIVVTGQIVTDLGILSSEWSPGNSWTGGLVDARTGDELLGFPAPSRFTAYTGSSQNLQWHYALSPDGRYVYAAPRSGKLVAKIDTTTFAAVAGLYVTTTRTTAAAARIALDPSGKRLYVGLTDGGHSGMSIGNNSSETLPYHSALPTSDAIVLEVDTATMTEASRTTVASGDGYTRLSRIDLAPDGRTLAAVTGSNSLTTPTTALHILELSGWTERDADSATAGIQTVPLGVIVGPNIAFDPTGRYVVMGQGSYGDPNTTFGVIDVQTMTLATHTASDRFIGVNRNGDEMLVRSGGYGAGDHLLTLDAATGTLTPMAGTVTSTMSDVHSVIRGRDGRIYLCASSGLTVFDADGDQLETFTSPRYMQQLALTH